MSTPTTDFAKRPHPKDLRLSRTFDAPREQVFDALTKAEHLKHFWAPKPFTIPVCEVDLKPGGVWHYSMRSPDGWEHQCTAVYKEVERPRKIAMTASIPAKDGTPRS